MSASTNKHHIIEIFSANCPLCRHIIDDIKISKCEGCKQIVYDINNLTNEIKLKMRDYVNNICKNTEILRKLRQNLYSYQSRIVHCTLPTLSWCKRGVSSLIFSCNLCLSAPYTYSRVSRIH